MTQKTPHVHADIIKDWADDPSRIVQAKRAGLDFVYDEWKDVPYPPSWDSTLIYRFKPVPVKTVGYRRYVYEGANEGYYVGILFSCLPALSVEEMERAIFFVKWIDKDWQYEIVEEE